MNFYYNLMFPYRAPDMPEKASAADLAVECVKKFSRSTLQRCAKVTAGKKIPLEAIFWDQFYLAFLKVTPESVPLIPQAPTLLQPAKSPLAKVVDRARGSRSNTKEVKGFIDLFANGPLQHGYEILRDGTRDEHARRFLKPTGRYSAMDYADRLVLDFIVVADRNFPPREPRDFPPLSPVVEKLKVVATFAFNKDFTQCAYKLPSGSIGQFNLEQP
mmetsp:Transcript_22815/g.70105  ORF Transcript_22815/g.70105 Transcript_22815/m.70105 type:complete len:216 (+) Transcript_22815:319-966(+)